MSFPELYQMVWALEGSLTWWTYIIALSYVLCAGALLIGVICLVKLQEINEILQDEKPQKKDLKKK